MDGREHRLDELSRTLARGPSRRAVVAGLGVLLTARTLSQPTPVAGEEGWVEDAERINLCRLPRFPCTKGSQCCAGGCQADGTCGCRKRGKRAFLKAVCCSGKKKRGNKGVCR
jgi:hypothetical protein